MRPAVIPVIESVGSIVGPWQAVQETTRCLSGPGENFAGGCARRRPALPLLWVIFAMLHPRRRSAALPAHQAGDSQTQFPCTQQSTTGRNGGIHEADAIHFVGP